MKNDRITLAHGNGGKRTHELINNIIKKLFSNNILDLLTDAAVLPLQSSSTAGKIAFTTDSYVIDPVFFPGGDIGKLSVCGTVNDLSVMCAKPVYLSCGMIIEEGFLISDLIKIAKSMKSVLISTGVKLVTGDIKIVQKGACDKIFINTSGIGIVTAGKEPDIQRIKPGDKIICSGTVGDHGIAVLSARNNFKFKSSVKSDCAPLYGMVNKLLTAGIIPKFMRDPTRGGIATTLNELAENIPYGIVLEERQIPVKKNVKGICELLGYDLLYMANEGKIVFVVGRNLADKTITLLKSHPAGKNANIIGEITANNKHKVILKTGSYGTRVIDMLVNDQLPRIC